MSKSLYKLKFLSLAFFFAICSFALAQDDEITGDGAHGFELFDAQCTACHNIDGPLVGPEMRNVVQRVKEEGGVGREWLHDWIKDNNALRESGDAYAIKVYEDNNRMAMLAFPNLSEQDIDDILVYTSDPEAGQAAYEEAKAKKAEEAAAAAEPVSSGGTSGKSFTGLIIAGFVILALLLLWVLYNLNKIKRLKKGAEMGLDGPVPGGSIADLIGKYNKAFGAFLGVLTLLALYGLWVFMIGIGSDKGYMPEQPIHFSHQVHAGVQGIDCQFCHSSAKYGKVSGIPSPNLCMNCHKTIKEYKGDYYDEELIASGRFATPDQVREFYTGEIHKMYAAIGWDPKANEFTGEQKPIVWERVHNLADFVYFSHEQHVVAGESAILKAIKDGTIPNADELNLPEDSQVCFACHGDVSKMTEVEMVNTLQMGWCVECHRTTEVDMDNGYNSQYYSDLHERLKKEYGEGTKITVDAIGGLECAKCHY